MKQTEKGFEYEYFPTPIEYVEKIICEIEKHIELDNATILDVGAGGGNFGRVLREYYPNCNIVQIDIRDECYEPLSQFGSVIIDDCLIWKNEQGIVPDIIISNPAFSISEKIIRRMNRLFKGVPQFYLNRLNFLSSSKRKSLHNEDLPLSGVWASAKRYSFLDNNKIPTFDTGIFVYNLEGAGIRSI